MPYLQDVIRSFLYSIIGLPKCYNLNNFCFIEKENALFLYLQNICSLSLFECKKEKKLKKKKKSTL